MTKLLKIVIKIKNKLNFLSCPTYFLLVYIGILYRHVKSKMNNDTMY